MLINAKEARAKTKEARETLANEFIVNRAIPAILKTCERGLSRTAVEVDNFYIGSLVAEKLNNMGYTAEYCHCEQGPRVESYINIDWSEQE